MKIIIIGCGRVGAQLAHRLFMQGHNLVVVDQDKQAFNNLHPHFVGRTVEGDALNKDVLHRAGIGFADALAAVTNSDALNAVVAHMARSIFGIQNVVVRNYDPEFLGLFNAFNLQVVSSASWGAQRMEEILYSVSLRPVFSAGNGEVEIYEMRISPEWDGRPIKELVPSENCGLVSLTRAGVASVPGLDEPMQVGDLVLISADLAGIQCLRDRLEKAKE
jgi:trk system potassium uptake protein TrkA